MTPLAGRSPWDLVVGGACVAVALVTMVPGELGGALGIAATIALLGLALLWYWQRVLRAEREEFPRLRMAAVAVQVLWLAVLYDLTAGMLQLPAAVGGFVSSLLLAAGAAALAVASIAALDLSARTARRRAWFVTVGFAGLAAAALFWQSTGRVALGVAGLVVGFAAPMGWLITLDRRQRVSVLAGGVLSVVPLVAAVSLEALLARPAEAAPPTFAFIVFGSWFCLMYVIMLLVRAAQTMSGAALYERKVQELDAVYDFGLTARTVLDTREFHAAVLRYLRMVAASDVAAIVEPDPGSGATMFSLLRADGGEEHVYRHRTRVSWEPIAAAFGDRRSLYVADHRRTQIESLRRVWEPVRGSSVCVPVLGKEGEARALLIAGRHERDAFQQVDIHSIAGFAIQVALAIEHARLMHEMVEAERRRSELEIARHMQLDLLPKEPPRFAGLDIADRSVPATEVGGDYFDYLSLPDGRLGVVVGDVAGHGMSAGLIMAIAKSAIHTQVRASGSPALLLPRLGEVLLEMSAANQYMTMVFTQLDVVGGRLWYVNAGHHFPLHYRADIRRIGWLESTGPPLGLLPEPPGDAVERPLGSGDVLAFYSDGLVEAFDPDDEEFGVERLGRMIVELAKEPAETIVDEVFAAVRHWSAGRPWHDDATLVIVRVVPG